LKNIMNLGSFLKTIAIQLAELYIFKVFLESKGKRRGRARGDNQAANTVNW